MDIGSRKKHHYTQPYRRERVRSFYKFLVVILIIGVGLAVSMALIYTKPKATRKPVSIVSPPVEIIETCLKDQRITVSVMGTLIPAREIVLQPQVSGTVVWQNDRLVPGAHVAKGELLVRIDNRDYLLALEQQKAAVAKARVALKTEKGRRAVAEREWNLLAGEIKATEEGRELALRIPQAEDAQASQRSAESALEKAELNLERTEIRAPFNALILEEFADVGQQISPGTKIATMVGTDEFWVQASIPLSDLAWIKIPGVNSTEGSPAFVIQKNGYYNVKMNGTVRQLLGDVDPKGRMARIIVSVKDPLGLKVAGQETVFPLLLGSYVKVEIQGQLAKNVCAIPRSALREGNRIWLLTDDDRLQFMDVEVVWTRKDDVFIRNGFQEIVRIITSRIPAPVEGMKLRIFDGNERGIKNQAPSAPEEKG
jgi:RND family efflux transporter MFP subunit